VQGTGKPFQMLGMESCRTSTRVELHGDLQRISICSASTAFFKIGGKHPKMMSTPNIQDHVCDKNCDQSLVHGADGRQEEKALSEFEEQNCWKQVSGANKLFVSVF
jgi:hypothetical protein